MLSTHYHPQPQYAHYAPPSPPQDDSSSRCSLPSISNLLGLADQGSPTSEASFQAQQQQQQSHVPQSDTRPSSSHYGNPPVSRSALPPSPPMTSDTAFEGYSSPSTKSVSQFSVATSSCRYEEPTPPLGYAESESRQYIPAPPRAPVQQPAYQAAQQPPQPPQPVQYVSSAYVNQPTMPSYYPSMPQAPPTQQPPQVSALYYQRPLPQAFPPPVNVPVGVPPAHGANPWQHHHYISPSSAASFPQSQDRYICPTCSKAFSRPSSLRIHSHSHTGEKPFKCPHAGCGKAFSVRSNMKRHERGCHNFVESSSNGTALAA